MTLDELKKSKDFEGFEVVVEPDKEGPYQLIEAATNDVPREARSPFHRQTNYDGTQFIFKYEDSIGYGFRSHVLLTKSGEMTSLLLRSLETKPSTFNPGGGGGDQSSDQDPDQGDDKSGDDKSGDDKSGDDKSGDDKSGDDKSGDDGP